MVLTVWTMLPFQNIINYVKCISGWQATALALHSSTPSPEQTQQTADGMHFISFLSEISVLYVLSVVCTQNQFLTTTSPLQNHRENREVKRIPQVLLYTGNREWQTLLWHEMYKMNSPLPLQYCFILTHYYNISTDKPLEPFCISLVKIDIPKVWQSCPSSHVTISTHDRRCRAPAPDCGPCTHAPPVWWG